MNKPVIGITGAFVDHNLYMKGVYVSEDYHISVANSGGIPIVLPFFDPELSLETLKLCDGIILSGGEDVDPFYYGQEPHQKLGRTIPLRDEVEIAIVNTALENNIPILAICRGVQLLNVALGGTLIQDIPSQVKDSIMHEQHSRGQERNRATHWAEITENSKLHQILGESKVRVNSLHHQALDHVADELEVVAVASDGIVEAVEHKSSLFTIGLQWHPESLSSKDPIMKKLFDQLIQASRKI